MKRATHILLILGPALILATVLFITTADVSLQLAGYVLLLLLPYGILWLARANLRGPRATDIILLVCTGLVLSASVAASFLFIVTRNEGQAFAWAALIAFVLAAVEIIIASLGGLAAWIITRRDRSQA